MDIKGLKDIFMGKARLSDWGFDCLLSFADEAFGGLGGADWGDALGGIIITFREWNVIGPGLAILCGLECAVPIPVLDYILNVIPTVHFCRKYTFKKALKLQKRYDNVSSYITVKSGQMELTEKQKGMRKILDDANNYFINGKFYKGIKLMEGVIGKMEREEDSDIASEFKRLDSMISTLPEEEQALIINRINQEESAAGKNKAKLYEIFKKEEEVIENIEEIESFEE